MMSCSSRHRLLASNLLLSGGKLWRNPLVEVDGEGRIVSVRVDGEVGECEGVTGSLVDRSAMTGSLVDRSAMTGSLVDRSAMTEFYSGIMMAGFVNAHTHLELSYLRGAIEAGGGFAEFASQIGRQRGQFTQSERLKALQLAQLELEREGVAGVGDIVNGETSYEIKASGRGAIEYRNFAELFGLRTTDMEGVEGLLKRERTSATPHSLYSLNDPIIREIAASGDRSTPLSIHFMESEQEQQLYDRSGALYDWYERSGFECDFLGYSSPAERLISVVPADRSVILVHNCCVTQRDIDLIMSHFTAPVYWCVCPRSNRYISNSVPPLDLLRRGGLNICVGTDSLASNWSLSIVEELRAMASVPLVERLDWATRIGAKALALNDLGDIEVGKRPRINTLSGIDYEALELTERSRVTCIVPSKTE
ncbi:MAG: amidohydrolase family protein [Rikenellaceae bacterium]